jgi:hypothetical protein
MSFLAFPIVGLLLAVRRPRNPTGWMFIVGPGLIGHGVALAESGTNGDRLFGTGILILLASLLLFPDGRYPGRLWMWAHLAVVAGVVIEPIVSPATDGGRSMGAAFFLTVGSLLYRATAGSGVTRRQLALPAIVGVVGAVGLAVSGLLTDSDWAIVIWMSVMTVGVPIAIALAVLRYRLFEIDRIVSRTVSYTLVALVVTAIYGIPVILLPRVLGASNDMVVAGSTLAAATAFNPARRRIQRVIDRRFDRARYDSEREIESFSQRLRGQVELPALTADLTALVGRTVAPSSAAIWIRGNP